MIRTFFISLVLTALLTISATAMAHHEHTTSINAEKALTLLNNGELIVLDVRLIPEYNKSDKRIKGAKRVNLRTLAEWIKALPKGKTVIVYCNSENATHSTSIAFKLQNQGLENVFYLEGGWGEWLKAGYPVEDK